MKLQQLVMVCGAYLLVGHLGESANFTSFFNYFKLTTIADDFDGNIDS